MWYEIYFATECQVLNSREPTRVSIFFMRQLRSPSKSDPNDALKPVKI